MPQTRLAASLPISPPCGECLRFGRRHAARGQQPLVEAALVKDIGTTFEREIPEVFRHLIPTEPTMGNGDSYAELLGMTVLRAPGARFGAVQGKFCAA